MGSLCVKDRETSPSSCASGLRTGTWACLQDLLVIVLTPYAFFPRKPALNTAEFSPSKKVRPRVQDGGWPGRKPENLAGKRIRERRFGEKSCLEDSDDEGGREGSIREEKKGEVEGKTNGEVEHTKTTGTQEGRG